MTQKQINKWYQEFINVQNINNNFSELYNGVGAFVPTCGYLVDSFSDHTTFSVQGTSTAGTISTLVGGGKNGENVLRLTLSVDGARSVNKTFSTPLPAAKFSNPRNGFFVQAVRVNDPTLIPKLQQFLFLSNGGYYQSFPTTNLSATVKQIQPNEWFYVVWSGSQMNSAGTVPANTPFDANTFDCTSLRIGVTECFAGGIVDFGALWYGVRQTKPVITFGFDDSNKTDILFGKPILDRFNFTAMTYTIRDAIGSNANSMTYSDLLKLYEAGWDVAVHGGASHYDTLITEKAIYEDMQYNLGIYEKLGIPRSYAYAYPEGEIVQASIPALRRSGFKYAGSVHSFAMPSPFQNPMMGIRSGTSGKTLNALKAEVDNVIKYGGMLEFFTHQLLSSATGIHTDILIFTQLVEYCAEKQEAGLLEAGRNTSYYFQ